MGNCYTTPVGYGQTERQAIASLTSCVRFEMNGDVVLDHYNRRVVTTEDGKRTFVQCQQHNGQFKCTVE